MKLGFDLTQVVHGADSVPRPKPYPDGLQLVLDEMGVSNTDAGQSLSLYIFTYIFTYIYIYIYIYIYCIYIYIST